jgi:Ni/Co efflux regulator RcnB
MRKLILLAAAAAIAMPGAAIAQRPHHDRNRTELRHDRHDVRQDRRELRRDRRHGDRAEARRDRRELRRDRRELRRDRHHRRHIAYIAPYRGWSYRPVTVGFRLRPMFYSPRYYISDYGYYGLRAPRPWERWIRYGDDLLLVNLRTGRVLSVIHYRYW